MDVPRIALVAAEDAYGRLFAGELERRGLAISRAADLGQADAKASVVGLVVETVVDGAGLMREVGEANKPVVALKVGAESRQVFEAAFRQAGAVVARDTGEFVAMLAGFGQYGRFGPTPPEGSSLDAQNDKPRGAQRQGVGLTAAVEPMNIEGSGAMDEYEAKRLLDRWGVPVVPETLVTGPGRHEFTPIRKLATHLGFPVALKAIRRDIVRKSDMGAVVVGIPTIDDLKSAWDDMHARFPDAAWLIQPFLPGDVELIVRATRDTAFGPVVTVGPGGIMTELYGDVALRIAPFVAVEALQMIEETKASALLRGFRGLPVHELEPIADVLVRVGDLMLGQPTVLELSLDPLLITEKGPVVVDAKAVIG